MQDPGTAAGLPAQYRIALAVSFALFLHTLVLSGLPLLFERDEQAASTLTFELVPPGSKPTPQTSSGARPERQAEAPRNPEFEVPPQPTPRPEKPVVKSTPSAQPVEPSRQTQRSDSAPSRASQQSARGTPAPEITDTPEEITRTTATPSQTDDYIVKLATRIAIELKRSRIRAVRALSGPVTMELELDLLDNGALTQARVTRSSGVQEIDTAAYRAALAASPYPGKPAGDGRKDYRVELVFSPDRKASP